MTVAPEFEPCIQMTEFGADVHAPAGCSEEGIEEKMPNSSKSRMLDLADRFRNEGTNSKDCDIVALYVIVIRGVDLVSLTSVVGRIRRGKAGRQ